MIDVVHPDFSQSTDHLDSFAPRLLDWFDSHGRHDLPWQQHKTDAPNPYIVWLSEVMLQQTQVTTVLPYFARFMQSFPTVQDLANADWDLVAEHWAGLGYYARARNLHKGAKQLVAVIETTGDFPQSLQDWEAISGVGRSTAGAIMAMGLHKYGVICDGNVKRVLTRWAAIDGDITKSATDKILWALATRLTPTDDAGHFAQAMMDLGATLCTRRNPNCQSCPLQNDCIAHAQGRETDFPVKAKKAPKPSKFSKVLLISNNNGEILWLKRPDNGIWGGLWSLPLIFDKKVQMDKKTKAEITITTEQDDALFDSEMSPAEQIIYELILANDVSLTPCSQDLFNDSPIKHSLTHFHWYLTPYQTRFSNENVQILSENLRQADIDFQWLDSKSAKAALGLPRAMVKVLDDF